VRIPELVVGMEVAVDEHHLGRSAQLGVHLTASASHPRALGGADHRREATRQLLGRRLQPVLWDAQRLIESALARVKTQARSDSAGSWAARPARRRRGRLLIHERPRV
jgi:hypothetical protein